jgi:MFS transporter, UMF2 family, putative MFS family transporter protein
VLGVILACTASESAYAVLPIFVDTLALRLHLSDFELGLLASADLAGVAISSASAMWWLRRVPWRKSLNVAFSVMLMTNLISVFTTDVSALLAVRIVAGLAAGVALSIGLGALAALPHTARNSALVVFSQTAYGAIGIYLLPLIPESSRLAGVYIFILLTAGPASLLCARFFPENGPKTTTAGAVASRIPLVPAFLAVIGTLLYFLMGGAVWGYLAEIAQELGLTLRQTSAALSTGLLVALIGSLTAAKLSLRWGTAIPVLLAAVVQIAALWGIHASRSFTAVTFVFFLFNFMFQFAWNFVVGYFVTIFASLDSRGRFVSLFGSAMHAGLAAGPLVGALWIGSEGSHLKALNFGLCALAGCYAAILGAIAFRPKVH